METVQRHISFRIGFGLKPKFGLKL